MCRKPLFQTELLSMRFKCSERITVLKHCELIKTDLTNKKKTKLCYETLN